MLLKDYIFCDDVRYETGNKLSLMGVYNDKIIVSTGQMPQNAETFAMKLVLYLRVVYESQDKDRPDKFKVAFDIDGDTLSPVAEGVLTKIDSTKQETNLVINFALPLKKSGHLNFDFTLQKGHEVLFNKKVNSGLAIEFSTQRTT